MTEASVNGIKRNIPDSWDEIQHNKKLYLYTLSLFFSGLNDKELLIAVALKFLKIKKIKRERVSRMFEKFPDSPESIKASESLYFASEHFDFIIKTKPSVDINLFPDLFFLKKLYGPDSVISQTGIWEFALAEKVFFDFNETNKVEHLDKMISILYRRKKLFYFMRRFLPKFNGDKRRAFNEYTYDISIKRISKIPYVTKWVIYRWFGHQRAEIIEAFPYVFRNKKEESDKDKGNWSDTLIAMSVVGDEEKTANTKMDLILTRINNENKALAEFKRKHKITDND